MKVLFIPFRETWKTDEQREMIKYSASSRWRCDWIAKYWDEVSVWRRDWVPGGYTSFPLTNKELDYVVFQKVYLGEWFSQIEFIKNKGIKVVFDLCDAEWEKPGRDKDLADVIRIADVVTCSSFYIQEYIQKNYRRNATLIVDRIDLDQYPRRKMKKHRGRGKKIIWFGNRNTNPYVLHLMSAINRVNKQIPENIELHVISDDFNSFINKFNSLINKQPAGWKDMPKVYLITWDINRVDSDILKGDVVINPHPMDNDTGRAKSDNKTITAWALGLPVVTSHGDDFRQASFLHDLLTDADLRNEVGMQGRKIVEQLYDVRMSVPEWKGALNA